MSKTHPSFQSNNEIRCYKYCTAVTNSSTAVKTLGREYSKDINLGLNSEKVISSQEFQLLMVSLAVIICVTAVK